MNLWRSRPSLTGVGRTGGRLYSISNVKFQISNVLKVFGNWSFEFGIWKLFIIAFAADGL